MRRILAGTLLAVTVAGCGVSTQQEVERNLAQYEQYVANREQLPEPAGMQTGAWG